MFDMKKESILPTIDKPRIKNANDSSNELSNLNIQSKRCSDQSKPKYKRLVVFASPGETFSRDPSKNLKFNSPIEFINELKNSQVPFKNNSKKNSNQSYSKIDNSKLIYDSEFHLFRENYKITKKSNELFKNCSIFYNKKTSWENTMPSKMPKLGIAGRIAMINLKNTKGINNAKNNKKYSIKETHLNLSLFQNEAIKRFKT